MAPKPVEQGDETFPDNIEDATCPDPKVTSYRDTTDPDGKSKPTVAVPIAAGASQDLAVVTKEEIFVRSLDKYEFLDKIGQGGMGKVFRVRHRELNRVEAIKVLNIFGLDQCFLALPTKSGPKEAISKSATISCHDEKSK